MKKHVSIILIVIAIALPVSVCYSFNKNYAIVKAKHINKGLNYTTKTDVAVQLHDYTFENVAVLNYGIVIEPQGKLSQHYVLRNLNNKYRQERVSYIWFKQDRRCLLDNKNGQGNRIRNPSIKQHQKTEAKNID